VLEVPADTAAEITGTLRRLELVGQGEPVRLRALAGGVSAEIWRVDTARGPLCVKRALARLRVAADWQAPVERNAYEVAWLQTARAILPEAVPRVVAHDPQAHLFVMEYLDPARFRSWKEELREGRVDDRVAEAVGRRMVCIHARTAGDPQVARRFATGALFHALRLEPYLRSTARAHPRLAAFLHALADATQASRRSLVHGDISPKNILIGPAGPVFLDAECAWYGDPAFDLAFCLNHLLLKCLWRPEAAAAFLATFDRLAAAYGEGVGWEPPADLEARAARLLPGLMLARIDGKSPVEYVTEDADRERVRRCAGRLLEHPSPTLAGVASAWAAELPR
jgi:aminoglycoside phosphotransferase (APT) family kinase protein